MRDPYDGDSPRTNVVIAVAKLSRSFGPKKALDDVTLAVPRGCVFGLVGENGAGKSTLIKHLLGLWRAEAGTVRVFGLDPVSDPATVLGRTGYLSEQPDLPDWMRAGELLRYTQAFYPRWDVPYAEQLVERFALDLDARIKTLSKGQRARLGLVAAEAHRPDLLILDEPSSGLDPIVRRDILEAIIRTITHEGRTVIFSSHLLDEVERVSDYVAMLHEGTLKLCASLDDIKTQHRRMVLRFDVAQPGPPAVSGAIRIDGAGREWTIICDAARIHGFVLAQSLGARLVEDCPASLDEIFVAHVGAAPVTYAPSLRSVS